MGGEIKNIKENRENSSVNEWLWLTFEKFKVMKEIDEYIEYLEFIERRISEIAYFTKKKVEYELNELEELLKIKTNIENNNIDDETKKLIIKYDIVYNNEHIDKVNKDVLIERTDKKIKEKLEKLALLDVKYKFINEMFESLRKQILTLESFKETMLEDLKKHFDNIYFSDDVNLIKKEKIAVESNTKYFINQLKKKYISLNKDLDLLYKDIESDKDEEKEFLRKVIY